MQRYYSKPFTFSLILHFVLISFLVVSFKHRTISPVHMAQPALKETIDAVAINERVLNKEIARLDNLEKEKIKKEEQRKRQQEEQRLAAIKKRKEEEARLIKVKEEKERLAKEAEAAKIAQQKLEEAKKKQLKEAELALAEIKKQKEEALKAKDAAEKERQKQEALFKKHEEERKLAEAKARAEQERLEKAAQGRAKQFTNDQVTQFAGLIQAKIHQNWRQPFDLDLGGKRCKLRVRLSESGEVIEALVVEPSGNVEFDRSAELAVIKSSPLPMPPDQNAKNQFRNFTFTFDPEAA